MSNTIRKRSTRSRREKTRIRPSRRPASGDSSPCSAISFPSRPDSGPRNAMPARNVIPKRTSPMTIQSSPNDHGPSTTRRRPLTTARSEAGMSVRLAIHSTSVAKAPARAGPALMARNAKNCIIRPPPIQTIAIETCTKSRNVYQVMQGPLSILGKLPKESNVRASGVQELALRREGLPDRVPPRAGGRGRSDSGRRGAARDGSASSASPGSARAPRRARRGRAREARARGRSSSGADRRLPLGPRAFERVVQGPEERDEPRLLAYGQVCEQPLEHADQVSPPPVDAAASARRRLDADSPAVVGIRAAPDEPLADEPVHRSAGRRLGRLQQLSERANSQGPGVDDQGERQLLRHRERRNLGLADPAAESRDQSEETLDAGGELLGLASSAHFPVPRSGTGARPGRIRKGVTKSATTAPTAAAIVLIQNAVTKADSEGIVVPAIVCAESTAAPTWPPTTPPTVRMTVFIPVATPVSLGRTESTMIFAMAAKVKGRPPPRMNIPATMCHGSVCQRARNATPAATRDIPSASGHFDP